jgi:hypothetical protein
MNGRATYTKTACAAWEREPAKVGLVWLSPLIHLPGVEQARRYCCCTSVGRGTVDPVCSFMCRV